MEISIKETEQKGVAEATENQKKAGLMTYSKPDSDYIIIGHTNVEDNYRGKGVGKQLLYKIVEMAREKNLKILPECSFAKAIIKKHSDLQDVVKPKG